MPLTDLLMLLAIVGYLGFNLFAQALLILERLRDTYHPYKAQAAKDSPEPLPPAMSYMDIALLGLSPELRAEFLSLDDPQRSSQDHGDVIYKDRPQAVRNNTLSKWEPPKGLPVSSSQSGVSSSTPLTPSTNKEGCYRT